MKGKEDKKEKGRLQWRENQPEKSESVERKSTRDTNTHHHQHP
jgi:hypothetical protein